MSPPPAPSHRWVCSERSRGTVLVELALILPFMLVIALTAVDLSRAFYVKSMLTSAAREGARHAIELTTPSVNGTADSDSVKARVNQVLTPVTTNGSFGLSGVTVDVSTVGANYRVSVSGNFSWLYLGALNQFGALFSNPQTLSASTAMRKLTG